MERKKKPSAEERKRWWKENIEKRGYCEEDYDFTAEEWHRMENAKMTPFEDVVKKLGFTLDDLRKDI